MGTASGLAAGEVRLTDGLLLRPGLRLPGEDGTRRATAEVDGTAFHAHLEVADGRLARVSLVVADEAVTGTGWGSYDPERLRTWHDAFLVERLGPGRPWRADAFPYGGIEYRFGWGTIASVLAPQDLDAHIALTYA